MKKAIKKVMQDRKGFTLAELLIVVAIISVLVAVSIPTFTSKLEKSREATDVANMRAAKARAVAMYLEDDANAGTYLYDAEKGTLVPSTESVSGYGKGTSKDGGTASYMGYTATTDAQNKVIKVVVSADGAVTESWQ